MKKTISLQSGHLSDDELRVRCAWLYFIGDFNQSAVAERLGITRVRVNKLIAEAREHNIVTVTVALDGENAQILQIEQALVERYALDFCIVTPPMGLRLTPTSDLRLQNTHRQIARRAVGVAAADFLRGQLNQGKPLTLGVAWGRTVEQMALHLNGAHNERARFISVMGSLTRRSAANPFEVVHILANRTGGEGYFMPVPFIANSPSDLKVLMSQRVVLDTLALARSADFIMTSLGELRAHSLVVLQNTLSPHELESIQQAGAVGDMLGCFFDQAGNAVDHDLNHRTAALRLSEISKVPLILLVTGEEKIAPLRAIMKLKSPKALIIDGDTAEILLDNPT